MLPMASLVREHQQRAHEAVNIIAGRQHRSILLTRDRWPLWFCSDGNGIPLSGLRSSSGA